MKRLVSRLLVVLGVLAFADAALAEPAWGSNCLSCHGSVFSNTIYTLGSDLVFDPDESATGAPDRGPLPTFRVARGATRSLQLQVQNLFDGDTYAVELTRLRHPGVTAGASLNYAADCDWAEWGENNRYYTDPAQRFAWPSGPTSFTYDITVPSDATLDFFDLKFAIGGMTAGDNSLFYEDVHFYLQVVVGAGDVNCDGAVNAGDIDPFVLALTDPAGYAAAFPACDRDYADVNGDGAVNAADIDPFVTLIVGP